eukprot:TRINITY_DN8357_c0_g1_i3.p1 TRINITY_DN8357_c0_g1~~TRINITY_DN8357_c0_g1_i3.p1  ORF type:complete len:589 (+),score=98.74 TRINITY_DN8357_c0_g1_i3:295-2061(+)
MWGPSLQNMQSCLKRFGKLDLLIITGYIASLPNGCPTTLKRNGSDFSASIFGALLDAKTIAIWTDVDGVYSADPRKVPEAIMLPRLSYEEATELAYFGAKVVHPSTMGPAVQKCIPIIIRNTFNANCPGSVIGKDTEPGTVKGFSSIDHLSLILVEGSSDRRIHSFSSLAQTLFGALRDANVTIVMVTQSCFEHLFRFAVPNDQADVAFQTLEQALFRELHKGEVLPLRVVKDVSIVAAVGEGVSSGKGIASLFFSAISDAGINIRAIGQGSAELSISMVVDQAVANNAIRALHNAFMKKKHIAPITFVVEHLDCIDILKKDLLTRLSSDLLSSIRVIGIVDVTSKKMMLKSLKQACTLDECTTSFDLSSSDLDWDLLKGHLDAQLFSPGILVDARQPKTQETETNDPLTTISRNSLHIVTTNPFPYILSSASKAITENHPPVSYEPTFLLAEPLHEYLGSFAVNRSKISRFSVTVPSKITSRISIKHIAAIICYELGLKIDTNMLAITDPMTPKNVETDCHIDVLVNQTHASVSKVTADCAVDSMFCLSFYSERSQKPFCTFSFPCVESEFSSLASLLANTITRVLQ